VEHRIEGSVVTISAEAKKLGALERGVHEALALEFSGEGGYADSPEE
jgi:hypothetical protein